MSSDHIWPILFFVSLAGNLILLFYRPLLRLLRRGEEVSEDEIMAMVEEGEESGAIERNEKELIENVFEFNNTTAEDVMIHRTDMVTLSLDDDEETILSAIRESGLSRFPVYQGNVDDIVGILSTRQYLLNFHVERPQELRALLRPAYFVPETVRADVLFRDMQSKKIHMAVVVDEYGGTSGLVTLEDLLEELVGNIYDEFDPQAEQEIIQLEENLWRVSGSADLDELAEAMDFQLPEDEDRDYDTLGGLVFAQLAVIPEDGSRPVVEALGLRIRVEELCDRRVEWALVEKQAPAAAACEERRASGLPRPCLRRSCFFRPGWADQRERNFTHDKGNLFRCRRHAGQLQDPSDLPSRPPGPPGPAGAGDQAVPVHWAAPRHARSGATGL